MIYMILFTHFIITISVRIARNRYFLYLYHPNRNQVDTYDINHVVHNAIAIAAKLHTRA